MATRSLIAIQDGEKYDAVYCHFDGYPSGVGATLEQFYKDRSKVRELISRGDMSMLGEDIDNCIFYAEKKGRIELPLRTLKVLASDCGADYLYIFSDKDEWIRYNI